MIGSRVSCYGIHRQDNARHWVFFTFDHLSRCTETGDGVNAAMVGAQRHPEKRHRSGGYLSGNLFVFARDGVIRRQ